MFNLLLLLRLLHVAGGVLWVGAAALYIAFIAPTIHGIGLAAQALELRKLSQELSRFEVAEFVLLSIAMLTMATARYFTF